MSQTLHQNLHAPHAEAMPPARADTATAGHPAGPTYAGVLSFMRRPYTRDLAGVDVAVLSARMGAVEVDLTADDLRGLLE